MNLQLSAINLYPVKSLGGIDLASCEVEKAGLQNDRRWLVVDTRGRFLSQRSHPALARIHTLFKPEGVVLAAPGRRNLLLVPVPDERLPVTVWRDTVDAASAPAEADQWMSSVLETPCRLAYMDDRCVRPISSAQGRPGEVVSFADGYPCLLISTASLAELNQRLDRPVPMDRFRPNLVCDGCEPHAEDRWRRVRIGDAVFRSAGPCSRCSVITVNQQTGRRGDEPLPTLATYRQVDGQILFGVNLVVERAGLISRGDAVHVED